MPKSPRPLTNKSGDVRELTSADIAKMRPAKEVLSQKLYAGLTNMNRRAGVRGPQKAPTKVQTSIRLSPEVAEAFRASGANWQTRIDKVLSEWLKTHSPSEI